MFCIRKPSAHFIFPDAEQLWVLDSVPGQVKQPENGDGEVEKVLQTLKNLPPTVPSRK